MLKHFGADMFEKFDQESIPPSPDPSPEKGYHGLDEGPPDESSLVTSLKMIEQVGIDVNNLSA